MQKHFPNVFPIHVDTYVPRRLFGLYLKEKIRQASLLARHLGVRLNLLNKVVVNINAASQNKCVMTACGMNYPSNKVVVCIGNQPTESFKHLLGIQGYVSTPYPEDRMLETVNGSNNVLIIGSGLTSVDAILALEASGYTGYIVIGSPSGVLPAVRSYFKQTKSDILNAKTLIKQIKDFRKSPIEAIKFNLKQAIKDIYGQGCFPDILDQEQEENGLQKLRKDLVTATRGHAHWQQLTMPLVESIEAGWSMMSFIEKQTFLDKYFRRILRYIAAFPIQNAKSVLEIIEKNRLHMREGLLSVTYNTRAERFTAKFIHGNQQEFDKIINATGSGKNLLRSEWPLIRNMQTTGLYCFNHFGCFKVNRTTLEVICQKSTKTKVYAPASGSYGEFIIVNFIESCIKHAKIVAEDIVNKLLQHS